MIFKSIKAVLILLLTSQTTFAQTFATEVKPSLIGFGINVTDFKPSFPNIGTVDPGYSLMFWKGLSKKTDVSVRYNGIFSDYTKTALPKNNGYINELEASLHLRPISDNHLLAPFISAGIGSAYFDKNFAPYVPVGVGLQLNMYNEGYIFLQANYRLSLDKNKLDNNTFASLGLTQTIGKLKAVPPKVELPVIEPVVIKDTDGDGVPDTEDACPDIAGLATLAGCPDSDGDGIADKEDKCPTIVGLKKYNGCPIPDSDGDGINDEEDKCPQTAGLARYAGCPIPDTDKDGINDEEDKCPTLPGTTANNGCPEVKAEIKKRIDVAANQIFFATGSAKLLAKSNQSLNEIATILQADTDLKLDIHGHTDNTGQADKNKLLSESRAKAVYEFLVGKGIAEARLLSAGFGQDKPVASNKTAAGRAKNRRVELTLHYN
ncbi:MAG TPA: OmpA family protein [Ferruginibacter sp.]|nr:OmpA family protein [Ferruginibacter sp.]HMP21438.1 OmpA family protein [Ferruginibacter sp.]